MLKRDILKGSGPNDGYKINFLAICLAFIPVVIFQCIGHQYLKVVTKTNSRPSTKTLEPLEIRLRCILN